jgi:hypothetical protein
MKCSYGFFLCASLLGVGLCGVAYQPRHCDTTASTDGTDIPATHRSRVDRETRLQAPDLAELRQEMARLKAQMWAQGQKLPAVGAKDVESGAPANDPRAGADVRAEEEQRHREYLATLDDAFRKEPSDPRWSSAATSAVQSAVLGDSDLRSLARGVECRSRSCRLELTEDRSGRLQRIFPMLILELSRELPSIVAGRSEDGSGAPMMVLYMSRRNGTPATAP